jgi:hypothetical protein
MKKLIALSVLVVSLPAAAQNVPSGAVIWHDRGDPSALNLLSGPGGPARDPGTNFRFIKESSDGTSPKFEVEDEHGVTWKVKMGPEVRSETAAARLLWAAGYSVDEDFYRPSIVVRGLVPLARGKEFVSGNTVSSVRLERAKTDGGSIAWSWYDNPFIGTREFDGLRVMMALINNWDLKDVNNGTSTASDGGRDYGITDLGAAFGRGGGMLSRSKADLQDYEDALFIAKVTATHVDFRLKNRPMFPLVFHVAYYRERVRMESVVEDIPIAHARWIGERLGALTETQIGDAFRAAGFSSDDVSGYARVVLQRIAALKTVGDVLVPGPPAPLTREFSSLAAEADAEQCLTSTCRQIPDRETLTAFNLKTPHARAIMGGFEQGGGIGGGVQLSSGGVVPGVEFRATMLTSTKGYQRFDLGAFLPNIGGSRNHADIWATDLQRDVDFYGIGGDSAATPEISFAMSRRSYQASLYRDLADHFQGGVYGQLMDASSVLDRPAAIDTSSKVVSYGAFLAYDSRDNSLGLTRGLDLYGRVASSDGLKNSTSAGYGWLEVELDARGFVPLGSPRTSLLLRTRGQFKTPEDGTQIPFYELSWLGGRTYLRGFPSYRFRDNNMLLLSTEVQQTMFALSGIRGIDVFAFADAGQAWGSVQAFDSRTWRQGYGGGLQYRHSRALAVRVEMGRSYEGSLIYASLGRGF